MVEGRQILKCFVESEVLMAKVHKLHCYLERNLTQLASYHVVARLAHTFVQFAWRLKFFARSSVFHSFFISVFRRICVKRGSPSRMNLGSVPVKSTIADAFPSRRPPSTTALISLSSCGGSSAGSAIGGSPLRFALVETNGPVRSRRSRSHFRSGTRAA